MARKLKLNNSGRRAFRRLPCRSPTSTAEQCSNIRGDMDDTNKELITLSLNRYMKLLADLNMLRAFAKTVYKFRKKMTPEKIEEYYEIVKM